LTGRAGGDIFLATMFTQIVWLLTRALARGIFAATGGLRVKGAERVPRRGGVLLCPNHVSDADPAAVLAALPRAGHYMAKEELFAVPVLGRLLRLWGAFPVRRDSADRAALRRAEALLKAGETVVIFPEGGGNPEGRLQPLHPGAMLVALRTQGVPVIPVALENTREVWPYGAPRPRRAGVAVRVTFGEPLDLSDLYGKKGGAAEEATRRLAGRLAEMLDQPLPEGRPKNRTAEEEAARNGSAALQQQQQQGVSRPVYAAGAAESERG